jgi:hypothetical protein
VSLEAHLRTLEQTIGRRTLAGYESIARNYLLPYFKESRYVSGSGCHTSSSSSMCASGAQMR